MAVSERSAPQTQPLLVIACGMIAREILAVKAQLRLDYLELTCLPAELHYYPDRIAPEMDKAIAKAKAEGHENIFVGYADCGTGGLLDAVCDKHGVARIEGPHCFAFYQGLERYADVADDDMTSFYATDFLCRHFDTFFMKPLGLDRHPELIQDYFGNYSRLIYLAQTDDPELSRVAEDAARLLGLSYERRLTGYGDLVPALADAADDASRHGTGRPMAYRPARAASP